MNGLSCSKFVASSLCAVNFIKMASDHRPTGLDIRLSFIEPL